MTKLVSDRILIFAAGVITLVVFVSVLAVFGGILSSKEEYLRHFFKFLFGKYIKFTFIVVFFVCLITLFLGSTLSFLTAKFSFFGSKILDVMLMLPLAIPSYILAFIYVGIMDYGSNFENFFGFRVNFFNIHGVIFIIALSLYPYVYLFGRAAFKAQGNVAFDVGKILGLNKFQIFYKISFKLARPALVSGLSLVLMETLSDYGTAAYLGIDTFSAGIFKLWFDLNDLGSASILSSFLVIFVLSFMVCEHKFANKKSYSLNNDTSAKYVKIKLNGIWNFLAFFYCFLVAFLGFIMPFIWLSYWGLLSKDLFNVEFYQMAFNSMKVALICAFLITIVAFFLNFAARVAKSSKTKLFILKFSSIGYAMPGAVIGVSLILIFSMIAKVFDVALLGFSLSVLICGYIVRFLATSILSFESGYRKISQNIDDAIKVMRVGKFQLLKIHINQLKHFFTVSFIIVFVDIIKELPLSLILRPFDFETLSIRAFFYATDERIYASALPSLLIVLMSLLALIYVELRRNNA